MAVEDKPPRFSMIRNGILHPLGAHGSKAESGVFFPGLVPWDSTEHL